MKILLISAFLPFPQSTDARHIVFNCIKELLRDHEFSLLSFTDSEYELQYVKELKKYFSSIKIIRCYKTGGSGGYYERADIPIYKAIGKRIRLSAIVGYGRKGVRAIIRTISLTPQYLSSYFSKEAWAQIRKITTDKHFDIILIAYPGMMLYIGAIVGGRTIFELHELPSLRLKRLLRVKNRFSRKVSLFFQWLKMVRYEKKLLPRFDKVLTITDVEKNILKKRTPQLNVSVLPGRVDIGYFNPDLFKRFRSSKNSLVFVGAMSRIENTDAVTYFCLDILPLIKKRMVDVRLNIVGARPTSEIQKLDERGDIMVTGFVKDVRPYIMQSEVFVAPIRLGGGMRIKVLEAMAMGKAIVSTSIGCEGIDVTSNENVMLADSPIEFALSVVELLSNSKKRKYLGENARRLIEEKYSKEIVARKLNRIFEEVANP